MYIYMCDLRWNLDSQVCMNFRVLVYEYVEKGDLHELIHGSSGRSQPLTWSKRMKIIQGVAKGFALFSLHFKPCQFYCCFHYFLCFRLAYFHEDLEPRITHQYIRPSKILLDYQWNPKIILALPSHSDIPINSAFVPSPNNLDEKIDVHCFGTLIMELVSGKLSVDESSPHVRVYTTLFSTNPFVICAAPAFLKASLQVYLVDWIKEKVVNHKIVDVLDPSLPEFPTLKQLKRVVLIALRCVDPEIEERPKMGDVIHMLQPHDLLLSNNVIDRNSNCVACSPSYLDHLSTS